MSDELEDELALEPAPVVPSVRLREPLELLVMIKSEGMRLDQYVLLHLGADFSRSEVQRAIEAGGVSVNGKTASKPSYKVRKNDRLRIEMPAPTHDIPVPEDIPLDVLYHDDWLAVINKPPDMVVHPAKGNWSGTLVNALQWHFREHLSTGNGHLRAGIVHRLDKDTSGVILVAKDDRTHRDLAMQFESRKVFKEYVALAAGTLDRDSDYIEGALKMHPHDRLRMIVSTDADAKPALSYYEVLERFRGFALVKVQPRTGRTHQIRVHLQHAGCPVLADKLYGGRSQVKLSELAPDVPPDADEVLIARQALHAFRLRFKHPRTDQWIEAEAPLPADMRRVLEALRAHRPAR
ncbi:RluA family pseudouridine synthase [Frigoriglobus tundricola]|uniref:Pseudouridine synthase n=1 Tax=Frigoriglobus tundricola TaxID=2774151 RepID=A0A6M5Z334_9BACT|nr:RluA family pseudouridine synthase [Frigoriglobus tundricola]QJX00496.1 Pseudouridine synthase [Frigoriglobus tundricola]